MFEIISLLCLLAAVILLIILSIIDLKIWILPDELNFSLALAGLCFHFVTSHRFLYWDDMAWGALLGAGMLLTIRFFANRHYGRDTLGLGDVKLLGAAGIWLGLEGVLMAVTLGAFAGLVHGLVYAFYLSRKSKEKFTIHQLAIPAGPGFAIGIVIAGAMMFGPYTLETLHAIFS
jgi:prepilin signal peptidase PulO-like enzyme (type II secretory pathway)